MVASMTIGALARQSGVKVTTIRFYERSGLLPPAERSPAGRRAFTVRDVSRLVTIRRARSLGYTMEEVRALLRLADASDCSSLEDAAREQLKLAHRKIADLERLHGALMQITGDTAAKGELVAALLNNHDDDQEGSR